MGDIPAIADQVRSVYGLTEHLELLRGKALEEAGELALACYRKDMLNEMVDLHHVLEGMAEILGINDEELASAKADKARKRGLFVPGLVWDWEAGAR